MYLTAGGSELAHAPDGLGGFQEHVTCNFGVSCLATFIQGGRDALEDGVLGSVDVNKTFRCMYFHKNFMYIYITLVKSFGSILNDLKT